MRANTEVSNSRTVANALREANGFSLPWTPDSPKRQEALLLRKEREYHRLLDDLEFHTVSRQLEIEKLGLPKTGESHSHSILILES